MMHVCQHFSVLLQGILLFGPPGTGKTVIAEATAKECGATFFSVKASDLAGTYMGDPENLVSCLFAMVRCDMPNHTFVFLLPIASLCYTAPYFCQLCYIWTNLS